MKKTQTGQPHQPAAPKRQNLGQKSAKSGKKEAAATHDANGFLIGSKEANWALLQASGRWYTELDEGDFGEAEGMGVVMGSNEWVMVCSFHSLLSFPFLLQLLLSLSGFWVFRYIC